MQTSLRCQSPLLDSVVKYLSDIPTKIIDRVMEVVARFTVGLIDSAALNKCLVQFAMPIRKAVREWRTWALSSFYWGNLWRAVVADDPSTWNVQAEDVELVKSYLRRSDKDKLRAMYLFRPAHRLAPAVVLDLQGKLTKWAWSLYYKHLRFLARYDKGLSAEDLVASILEAGVRALRRYEHQNNPKKTLNFAKRAVKNEAFNLIGRYTRSKRACLVREEHDPDRQFLCRAISFEQVRPVLEKKPQATADEALFTAIRVELGHAYEQYARAILGARPEFDRWVTDQYAKDPERLPKKRLEKCARAWAGITTEQARANLAPFLLEKLSA